MSLVKHWCCNSSTLLHASGCDQVNVPNIAAAKIMAALPATDHELTRLLAAERAKPAMGKHLPTEAAARKATPLWTGLVTYFPDALVAVAQLSHKAGEQHHPGQAVHWERGKSTDHHDTLLRHLWECGDLDTDGVRHSAKVAWRALAILQLEIEKARASR